MAAGAARLGWFAAPTGLVLLLAFVTPMALIVRYSANEFVPGQLMRDAMTPGGQAILSGILESEADVVVDALRDHDWQLRRTHVEEEWWSALVQHR